MQDLTTDTRPSARVTDSNDLVAGTARVAVGIGALSRDAVVAVARHGAGVELTPEAEAAIGASRAVVETGMFPATAQIGQTGKVVSPDVYFAVGLSGAVQHTAGMSNSRVIVAVNRDPDAPIMRMATYALVGDLYKILPPLIEELRRAKAA